MSPRIPLRLLAVQSDERLVKLVREGHERAFDALVHRYRRPLLRYCRRRGLSDSRAEDVLQLALLNAWLALAGGAEVRDLRPWLYRIAHNGALNALRGPAEQAHIELTDAVPFTVGSLAGDDLDRRIAVCDALADVAALPPLQRQAILLTAVAGKTHDEAAGALGVNQDAVRGLLYRARATLRSAAAVTPQPLLGSAGSAGSAGSTTERLCELSAGGGALSLTAALVKGAAVAVTAGALLGGASVMRLHSADGAHGSGTGALHSTVASPRGDRASAAAGGVAASAATASETDASVESADRGPRAGAHVLLPAHRPSSTDPRRTPSQGAALQPRGTLAGPDAEGHGSVAAPIAQEGIQLPEDNEAGVTAPGERGDARSAGSSGNPSGRLTPGSSTSPAREGEGSDRGGFGADGSPSQSPAWGAPGEAPHKAGHAGSGASSGASEAPVSTG